MTDSGVAVVTGGASGLGEAFVRVLGARGFRVAILDIDEAAATSLATSLGAHVTAQRCDVSDGANLEAALRDTWDRLGPFALLVNNAGVMGYGQLADADPRDLQWQFSINVQAPWLATRFYYRRLGEAGGRGRVINISSEHGLGVPHVEAGFYTATKHALLGMSDVMATEMQDRLTLTVACPGIVATQLWNSTRNRPPAQGGQASVPALLKSIQAEGKPAAEVVEIVLRASEAGERYVLTHAHLRNLVQTRADAMLASLDRYVDAEEGDTYDVATILRRLRERRKATESPGS